MIEFLQSRGRYKISQKISKKSILSEEILQKIEENAIMMRESGLPKRLDLPDEILQRTVDVSLPELHGIVPEESALQEVKLKGKGTIRK